MGVWKKVPSVVWGKREVEESVFVFRAVNVIFWTSRATRDENWMDDFGNARAQGL